MSRRHRHTPSAFSYIPYLFAMATEEEEEGSYGREAGLHLVPGCRKGNEMR